MIADDFYGYDPIGDAWEDSGDFRRELFIERHLQDVLRYLPPVTEIVLEDPVKRLEVIVALRALGYSVESA